MPTASSARRNPAASSPRQHQPWDPRTVGPACIPPAQRLEPSERWVLQAQDQHRALVVSQSDVDTALHHVDVLYTQVLGNAPGASRTAWLSRFYSNTTRGGTSTSPRLTASKQGSVPCASATTADAGTTDRTITSTKRNASPRRRLCSPRQGALTDSTFGGSTSMAASPRRARQDGALFGTGRMGGGGGSSAGGSNDFSPSDYPQKMNWSHFSFEAEARRRARLPSVAAHTGADVGLDGATTSTSTTTPRTRSMQTTVVPLPPIPRGCTGPTADGSPAEGGCRSSPPAQTQTCARPDADGSVAAPLPDDTELYVSDAAATAAALDDACDDLDYRCETFLRENVNDDVWCFNVADETALMQLFHDWMQPSEVAARLRREVHVLGVAEALRTPKDTSLGSHPAGGRQRQPSLEVRRRSSCFQDDDVPREDTWLCVERSHHGQGASHHRKALHGIRRVLHSALLERQACGASATTTRTSETVRTPEGPKATESPRPPPDDAEGAAAPPATGEGTSPATGTTETADNADTADTAAPAAAGETDNAAPLAAEAVEATPQ